MRSDLIETEVIIIGAGPTGLATANYLGLFGIQVILVERNNSTVAEPRAVSIDDESLRSMQTLGISDQVVCRTLPGYGARYYTPGQREFARIKPTTLEYGHPRRSAFHQPELEAELLKGLSRFPNVKLLFQHSFCGLEQHSNKVYVTLRDPNGISIKICAAFLAGCDGGRSSVRQAIGARLTGSSFEERWLVLDTVNDQDPTPDSVAYCDHRRPAITLPGFGRTRRWEFLVYPGEDADQFLQETTIQNLLRPYIGDRSVEVVRKLVYTFQARVADKWREGRVFLLGDSAHLTPPYAGQGLNSGQRDAANFAWKVAGVIRDKFTISLMDTYQRERRDHAWALIKMAIQIGWVMVPRNWIHTYGQAAFFKLAGLIPKFRDYIMGLKFKPVPRFRDGFLCPDEFSGKNTLVGKMLPQPMVQSIDGRRIGLDELLGPGFALLLVAPETKDGIPKSVLDNFSWLEPSEVTLSRDDAGHLAFRPYWGKILLVRPDRYVAAAFDPNAIDSQASILAILSSYSSLRN